LTTPPSGTPPQKRHGDVADLLAAGIAHHQAGRIDEAARSYAAVLSQSPGEAGALHYLGVIAYQRGNALLAIDLIGRALIETPNSADANHNAAIVEAYLGRASDAHPHAARAVAIDSGFAQAWNTLGAIRSGLGRRDQAMDAFNRAVALDPSLFQGHNNRGNAHQAEGRVEASVACYGLAIALNPHYGDAHNNLGNALLNLARVDDAVASLERAVVLSPELANASNNLAVALQAQGRNERARTMIYRSLALNPDSADAHNNLGTTLGEGSDVEGVIAAYRRALELRAGFVTARSNLANTLRQQGWMAEAQAEYRRALALEPSQSGTHSSLLMAMLYDAECGNRELFAEYQRWAAQHAAPLHRQIRPHANVSDRERRLRIGYVSGDFADHPLTYNIEDMFERRDRGAFEVFCYAQVPNPDAVTARFQRLADHWRSTVGMTDAAVDAMIRADGIDILVNLAGHTANSRLLALAARPAPVQVSYGIGTSGMTAVDYWLTDSAFHPDGSSEGHTEELWRLPVLVIHRPPPDAPAVTASPAREHGYVTFGSFNNPSKLTDRVIALWAAVMKDVPDSRLTMKFFSWFKSPLARRRLIQAFAGHGIAAERLNFLWEGRGRRDHLEQVAGIDVALDAFPFNGWTTTFEALWMGVPVVTLAGDRFLARIGASFLTAAGLGEFVAETPDHYRAIAVRIAQDRERLQRLRAVLRRQMAESPLCDAESYTRSLEAAYRAMWRRWCDRHDDRR